jgi:hypothetical protein
MGLGEGLQSLGLPCILAWRPPYVSNSPNKNLCGHGDWRFPRPRQRHNPRSELAIGSTITVQFRAMLIFCSASQASNLEIFPERSRNRFAVVTG